MSTTLTPPDSGASAAPARPPVSPASRAVAIVLIAVGAIVAAGTLVSTVVPLVVGATSRTATLTAASAGIDGIRVDTSAGAIRVEYADVTDVELEVTGPRGADDWSLSRTGEELVVTSDRQRAGWNGSWLGSWWGRDREAVLRLPRAAEGRLDADLSIAGGTLDLDGAFDALRLDLAAGAADLSGSARSVIARVSAGATDVRLAGVRTADLSIEAGGLDARFTGSALDAVTVSAAAGSATVTLPAATYAVTRSVERRCVREPPRHRAERVAHRRRGDLRRVRPAGQRPLSRPPVADAAQSRAARPAASPAA